MKKLKGVEKKLDDAWSLLVKLRAENKCEVCRKESPLNSHHIFSRSNKSVRWDVMNGVCLCVGCHTFSSRFSAHKTPTEFTFWLIKKKGQRFLDGLNVRARSISKMHDFEKEILLGELLKEIKSLKRGRKNHSSMKVFEALYNPMIEESGYSTLSVHNSFSGANRAIAKHKEETLKTWRKHYPKKEDEPHPFGLFQDWCIYEKDILD